MKGDVPDQIDELLVADGGSTRLTGLDLQNVQRVSVHLRTYLGVT